MLTLQNIQWLDDATSGGSGSGILRLLDQTRLPTEETYLDCRTVQHVYDAIQRLAVRGAPAIGVAAAYGCVIALREPDFDQACDHLAASRPTAVNLTWAITRMRRVQPRTAESLLAEARAIHAEDADMCRRIGEHALPLLRAALAPNPQSEIPNPKSILTHCNAGALATGGIGTATAPMYLAHQQGLRFSVFADETRPLLQGARLTAYELAAAGIDVTLITDSMAGHVMRQGRIAAVFVGADRIASNGDTANKIGTYPLAVLARHHHIPFYVAAPSSTFDLTLPDGSHIPIEERSPTEITSHADPERSERPGSLRAYNPAFDVTPANLITAIITERGPIQPVTPATIARTLT